MKVKRLFEEGELYSSNSDKRERFNELEKRYKYKASFKKDDVVYVKFSNSKEHLEDWLNKLRDSARELKDKKTKIYIVSGVVETSKN